MELNKTTEYFTNIYTILDLQNSEISSLETWLK